MLYKFKQTNVHSNFIQAFSLVFAVWLCNLIPGGALGAGEVKLKAVWLYYAILFAVYWAVRFLSVRLTPVHEVRGVNWRA